MRTTHTIQIFGARLLVVLLACAHGLSASAQAGGALRTQADALFEKQRFNEALPLYAQLVSLTPGDHELNYRLGACVVESGDDKDKAVGFLKYAVQGATAPPLAWYYLGRAYHVTYRFKDALDAYQHFRGMGDKKALTEHPVAALEKQCGNGLQLLSNLKDVNVHSRTEAADAEFFRYYDLSGIGGRIVVTPEELLSALDKKSNERSLIYLPEKGGRIYFSSLGKDGRTGRDIYTTQLLPDGRFEEPRKLAGYVNTDQDESFAAMAPDGRTLYFASKGHNSMGGYDIFKCTYDQGNDVYGPPVNMDFAVNTPADDYFYMVDGEGQLACFASDRDSEYGRVNVYRVSTDQRPVIITVLKGTFADMIDPSDRDAHILVEDAVTHEQVADVRSDINGEYVLSLPRNGRYKFSVVAGRSGRTHVGMVEVPKSATPRAYRQELKLVNDGGEKLVIRNYFDEPLPDDLIALALEEIKRRARLDVGTAPVVSEEPEAAPPTTDAITAAGFTGDMTREQLLTIAGDDASDLNTRAGQAEDLSGAAYGEAVQQLSLAQQEARRSQDLLAQADATPDATEKNDRMTQAAEARQRSRLAALQARAAFEAGSDLGADGDSLQTRAREARALSDRLNAAWKTGSEEAALAPLRDLKARMDERNGPTAAIGPDERARRAAVEAERAAALAIEQANAKRTEEDQLTDQVNRLKRERDAAKGARKEQLGRQVAEYEGYRDAMHAEVEQAFAKARELERNTAVARAQASLTRQLTIGGGGATTELDASQIAALEEKLAETDRQIATLPIDERYDAMVEASGTQLEQRTQFDWELADATEGTGGHSSTEVVPRDASAEAQRQQQVATTVQAGGIDARLAQGGAVPEVGTSRDAPGVDQRVADANGGQDTRPMDQLEAGQTATAAMPSTGGSGDRTGTITTAGELATVQPSDTTELPLTPEASGGDLALSGAQQNAAELPVSERIFIGENDLAETRQLRAAARTRTQRDSLDARIVTLEQELASLRTLSTELAANPTAEAPGTQTMDTGALPPVMSFGPSASEQQVIDGLFGSYASDRRRIEAIEDARDRNTALNGLELMLVDSLSLQSNAQLAELERHPERASDVLPRVDRLRQMKEAHQRYADEAAEASRTIGPTTSDGLLVSAQGAVPVPDPEVEQQFEERYVAIQPEGEYIYESKLETRSSGSMEAVAELQRDVVALIGMEERIDSLEDVLEEMPAGRESDRMRDRIDRIIDDRMILRMEMGQRSAFITRQEWQDGQDSLQGVRTEVVKLGLPPSEPMMVLARQMEDDARQRFDQAAEKRKRADRSEDIVMRDSLYRSAYALELSALRDLDRAITVNSYVISDHFKKGDRPAYAELEARLFGIHQVTDGTKGDQSIFEGERPAELAGGTAGLTAGGQVRPAEPPAASATADPVAARAREIYQQSLESDATDLALMDASEDPTVSVQRAEEARRAAYDKEQQSLALGDRASELRDSIALVRKRDREAVETLARLIQLQSDTLHMAALALNDSAASYEMEARKGEAAKRTAENLRKFYYLTEEEANLVFDDADNSRYFALKANALETEQLAIEASQRSAASKQLAGELLKEMQDVMAPPDGSQPAADAAQRSARLNEQVVALNARADSLDRAADRARSNVDMLERQAAVVLERMDPVRSSELMAFEQRARRTEPWLASAFSIAGEGMFDFEAMDRSASAREAGVAQVAPSQQVAAGQQARDPVAEARPEATGSQVVAAVQPGTSERPASAPVTGAAAPSGSGANALASAYIAPVVLTSDVFELRDERIPSAIAIDAPKPSGIVYSVQVGAFRKPIPSDLFGDMIPVMGESAGNGLTRYTVGLFDDIDAANKAKEMVRGRGYRDAFVVVYKDGKRVSMAQARGGAEPPPTIAQQLAPTAGAEPPVSPVATGAVEATRTPASGGSLAASPAASDSALLARYPASAQEIIDAFVQPPGATDYYNDPSAAPARQVETVKGLFFTVQVGVYSKPVALDKLYNITPLNSERTETGKIRYTTGLHLDMERARQHKDRSVDLGVKDAFVTAYLNGRRIPVNTARALLARHGSAILADPSLETR